MSFSDSVAKLHQKWFLFEKPLQCPQCETQNQDLLVLYKHVKETHKYPTLEALEILSEELEDEKFYRWAEKNFNSYLTVTCPVTNCPFKPTTNHLIFLDHIVLYHSFTKLNSKILTLWNSFFNDNQIFVHATRFSKCKSKKKYFLDTIRVLDAINNNLTELVSLLNSLKKSPPNTKNKKNHNNKEYRSGYFKKIKFDHHCEDCDCNIYSEKSANVTIHIHTPIKKCLICEAKFFTDQTLYDHHLKYHVNN